MTFRPLTLPMLATALLIAFVLAGTAAAVDMSEPSTWTGVKGGVLFSGTLKVDDFKADQNTSYYLEFFSDFPTGGPLYYGPSIAVLHMDWSSNSDSLRIDDKELMLDIGFNFKGQISLLADRAALRPGAGIGYGVMKRRASFNGTNYLTLKAFIEMVFSLDGDRALMLDGGVWYSPVGGDSETDLKIGPLAFVRAGIAF